MNIEDALQDLQNQISDLKYQLDGVRKIEIGGVWQDWTPVWTASTTNPSLGDGTLTGRYCSIGRVCFLNIHVNMGSTTTYGSGEWFFSVPIPAASAIEVFPVKIYDAGTAWFNIVGKFADIYRIYTPPVSASFPMTWAASDFISMSVVYAI